MRSMAVVVLLAMVGGCGMAPTEESQAVLAAGGGTGGGGAASDPICSSIAPWRLAISSPPANPWGSHVGVITIYATSTDGVYDAYGTDYPYTQVYWYLLGATAADIGTLEAYPQSMRWCIGPQGSVGGGAAPKGQPDPYIYGGVCVPPTIATDVVNAYKFGPYGDGTNGFCLYDHGGGGCVPKTSCGTLCGSQPDGCGGVLTCAPCHYCPCGGVYPHCQICSTF